MCLILAVVEKIHSVETRNTSLVELSKREALREYNTGEVTGSSALTFPERAMKVTGHCSLQRDSRVEVQVAPKPVECFLSRRLPLHSDLQASKETRCPLHTHVFLNHVREHRVTIFPFRWIPEDC